MRHCCAVLVLVALSTTTGCDVGDVSVGADSGAGGGQGGGAAGRYHPADFAIADVHGAELRLQQQDCRACHGQELTGQTGPSCDGCHTPAEPQAWRSDCTFCHGGTDNQTGAPPSGLDGMADDHAFGSHSAHTSGVMAAIDCIECHDQPADILATNHVFDSSPGTAEASFAGGRSSAANYDGATCSNLYCHGDGRDTLGSVTKTAGAMTCTSCHGGAGNTAGMSGDHNRHVNGEGNTCNECHQTVAAGNTTIADPALHINGSPQVAFTAAGFTYDPATGRCTGTCHGQDHDDVW